MACLYKRGEVWWIKGMRGGVLIRRPGSRDRRIAEGKLADFIKESDAFQHGHAPVDLSWQAFRVQFAALTKPDKKEHTRKKEARAFDRLESVAPIMRLRQLTPDLLIYAKGKWVEALIHERGLLKGKVMSYTINQHIQSIISAMKWAEKHGYANTQDWSTVKYIKVPKGRLHFLTVEELGVLKAECRGAWLTILYLGARAGLRCAEMHWLEWSDVDFANNRVHIGPKPHWTPKGNRRRWIPMPPDLRNYLKSLPHKTKRVLGPESEIPSINGMSVYFKRLAKRAGVKASLHTLRHTYASHYVQNGGNIYKLKEYLGHASIATTQIYAHMAPADADKTLETMPGML